MILSRIFFEKTPCNTPHIN